MLTGDINLNRAILPRQLSYLHSGGAILGDEVQIGCNAVTNPGTLLGRGSIVFPVTSVRAGYYEPNCVILSA
jgi:acetyltransferase-like isoleucine patch superfamily enzyme